MEQEKLYRYLKELTYVRFIGVAALIIAFIFGWLTFAKTLAFISALLVANFATYLCRQHPSKQSKITLIEFMFFLIFDSLLLFFLLAFTGGAHNPFAYLFLVQMAFSAQLLETKISWIFALYLTVLYTLLFFIGTDLHHHLGHDTQYVYHLLGMLVTFSLLCFFLVYFVGKTLKKIKKIEENEKEKEALILIGSFAAQAAHQMGTPLNSLTLMAERTLTKDNPYKKLFISELDRCKIILNQLRDKTDMLKNTQKIPMTLRSALNQTINKWHAKSEVLIDFKKLTKKDDPKMFFDTTWEFAILNLLDNAYEAGARKIEICYGEENKALFIKISDDGPGFSKDILEAKSFHHGLGLYLTHTTFKQRGGQLVIGNHSNGAYVLITWKKKE